ncbi:MAG: SOS response-associated peptidase [Caldicoprobacterales bacterium]
MKRCIDMCGRYLLDTEIREIIKTYKILRSKVGEYKTGEIFPSTSAPIIFDNDQRTIDHAKWGFPFGFKKGIVINARSETIMNKPMFKNSFFTARCIIPANFYYEWKEEDKGKKVKYGIGLKDRNLISLGGIFKLSIDESQSIQQLTFVIITTEAVEGIKNIHSRMPLIIQDRDIEPWLDRNADIKYIQRILKSRVNGEFNIEKVENKDSKSTDGEDYQQLRMF